MVATIRILSGLDSGEFNFVGLSYNPQDMKVELSSDIQGSSFPIIIEENGG